jgi:hypothetical protein
MINLDVEIERHLSHSYYVQVFSLLNHANFIRFSFHDHIIHMGHVMDVDWEFA